MLSSTTRQRRHGSRWGETTPPSLSLVMVIFSSVLAGVVWVARYSMHASLDGGTLPQLGDGSSGIGRSVFSFANSSRSRLDDAPPSGGATARRMRDEPLKISVSRDARSLGVQRPEYVSTTLDWWPLRTEAWGNSSVVNADLSHPNLVAAAKGLSPFFLRIGGSQADDVFYLIPREGNDADGDADDLKQCKKKPQKCLTSDRWGEVLDFARRSGARVLFTLAYVRHTRDAEGRNDKKAWDSSNARRLLEYTASSTHAELGTVFGFELGNELRHKNKVRNVTRIVDAHRELRRMVDDIWGEAGRQHYPRPKILGPASTGRSETSNLVAELGPYLDHVSYHKYHGEGTDPPLGRRARHPSFYSHPLKLSGPGEAIAGHMTNRSELWVGEGAMAYNSGKRGITDSFHGSMWFANLLGALSKTGPVPHSVYCRQALVGGNYELVSHETLVPNPDYWMAYVWKNVVGTEAVGPILSPARRDSVELSSRFTFGCCREPGRDEVLLHAFCAKKSSGDVVFVVINISESKAIELDVATGENRTEYVLRPNEDGYESRDALLNGRRMSIENGLLPEVSGIVRGRNERARVPPTSIAFLVVHGAGVKECFQL